jgi:ABC-type nitrate/sulfonate/bicarbonate transport system substrate-binding protein
MDKISFPYRSSSHLVLLHVIAESGAWEKHGLDVNYDQQISSSEAHRAVPLGEVEFVGGNHVSTYGRRARGDSWVYLGQAVNQVNHQLAVRDDGEINRLADLKGKKVGTHGNHPSLNDWLFFKQQGLDSDRDDIQFIKQSKRKKEPEAAADAATAQRPPWLWELVRDRVVDAALLVPPASLFAEAGGLKLIDVEPLPMIHFTTVSSSLGFVEKHPDIVERFLKGLIEGIHFFKTKPDQAIRIIRERVSKRGQMNLEQATITHRNLAGILEPKLYPKMQSIANVYEEAIRQDKDAEKINPMELWDLHYIRRLDDMGFADALYGKHGPSDGAEHDHVHDHVHDLGHGETASPAAAAIAGLEGIVSTACDDDDCGAKH